MLGLITLCLIMVARTAYSWDTLVCKSLTDESGFGACVGDNDVGKRMKSLEEKVLQLQKMVQATSPTHTTISGIPKDCEEIYSSGTVTDGMYSISPDGRCPFFVYCDMTNGGWTVIQKRIDGSVNFYRTWDEYVQGFGDLTGEHWLGLDKIHRLTKDGSQIYFDMNMWGGRKEFAHYKVFTVHGAATAYTMNVDPFGYDGSINELFSYHDNQKFSTFDRDNDKSSSNCCEVHLDGGGWWYNNCYKLGNPNGVYGKKQQGGIGYWEGGNIPVHTISIRVKAMNGTC